MKKKGDKPSLNEALREENIRLLEALLEENIRR
jgi:hypothetical protein